MIFAGSGTELLLVTQYACNKTHEYEVEFNKKIAQTLEEELNERESVHIGLIVTLFYKTRKSC